MTPKDEREAELFELEKKKVKALEKISNSLDAIAIWFEEINKIEWSNRIQFYLAEYLKAVAKDGEAAKTVEDVEKVLEKLTTEEAAPVKETKKKK